MEVEVYLDKREQLVILVHRVHKEIQVLWVLLDIPAKLELLDRMGHRDRLGHKALQVCVTVQSDILCYQAVRKNFVNKVSIHVKTRECEWLEAKGVKWNHKYD